MDLFGRKAKIAQELAEAQLDVALGWIADLQNRLDLANAQDEIAQGVRSRLVAEVQALQRKNDELVRQLEHRHFSPTPLYKTDEEVELEYALRNGDINQEQFSNLMATAGFENTEVELPTRAERPIIY